MFRCKKNRCQDRKLCVCLVPVWSECYVCCGWRCESCGGTLNFRKPIPDYDERQREREQFAKTKR
jgi:hypothetical protein